MQWWRGARTDYDLYSGINCTKRRVTFWAATTSSPDDLFLCGEKFNRSFKIQWNILSSPVAQLFLTAAKRHFNFFYAKFWTWTHRTLLSIILDLAPVLHVIIPEVPCICYIEPHRRTGNTYRCLSFLTRGITSSISSSKSNMVQCTICRRTYSKKQTLSAVLIRVGKKFTLIQFIQRLHLFK